MPGARDAVDAGGPALASGTPDELTELLLDRFGLGVVALLQICLLRMLFMRTLRSFRSVLRDLVFLLRQPRRSQRTVASNSQPPQRVHSMLVRTPLHTRWVAWAIMANT